MSYTETLPVSCITISEFFALSETQSIHGGISDLVVDGSERNTILV